MRKIYLLSVLVLLICQAAAAFDPYEMPYGVYITKDYFATRDISIMDDALGINFVYGISDSNTVSPLSQAGYDVIKWGSQEQYNPNRMSGYSYLKAEAEDVTSPIRFERQVGNISGDFLVASAQDTVLDDLWFGQYPVMHFADDEDPKVFFAKIRLAIDPTGMTSDSLIGRILVHAYNGTSWQLRATIPVYPDSALLAGDTVEAPSSPPSFQLCGEDSCDWGYKAKYSFWNSGKTTVYLDYFKSYEEMGRQIINGDWDNAIAAAVTGGWKNYVDYWWLRDEPRYDHFMPMAKVRSVVNNTTGDLSSITALLLTSVRGSFDTTDEAIGLRSFVQLTGLEKIVINDYPFCGGNSALFTKYTGYGEQDVNGENFRRGLQMHLDSTSCELLGVVARQIKADTTLKEFWSSPQCYFQVCDSDAVVDSC